MKSVEHIGRPRQFHGENLQAHIKKLLKEFYASRGEKVIVRMPRKTSMMRKHGLCYLAPEEFQAGQTAIKLAWLRKPQDKDKLFFVAADVVLGTHKSDDKIIEVFEASLSTDKPTMTAHFGDVKRIII
jgi:hypothetical protein